MSTKQHADDTNKRIDALLAMQSRGWKIRWNEKLGMWQASHDAIYPRCPVFDDRNTLCHTTAEKTLNLMSDYELKNRESFEQCSLL